MPAVAPLEPANNEKDAVTQELAQLCTDDPRARREHIHVLSQTLFRRLSGKRKAGSPEETFTAPDRHKPLYRSPI